MKFNTFPTRHGAAHEPLLGSHIDLAESNLTQKGKVDAGQMKFLAIAADSARLRHRTCDFERDRNRRVYA